MTGLRRYLVWLQRILILILLCAGGAMLVGLWLSGASETKSAVESGRRYIIHIEDGKVEGLATKETKESAASEQALPPPPPPAEEKAIDVSQSIQRSSSPIPEISDDLVDRTAGAPLPKISSSGMQPWQYYAKTFRRQSEMPMIAIVVTGLGQSEKSAKMAFSLDDRIGLSFSPYAASVASWAAASRISGHEMFVDLPLQTINFPADDPGPYSILTSRSNTENNKNLLWAMSRFQGYVGLFAPMNELVTVSPDTFKPLSDEMAKRGVMLLMARDAINRDTKGAVNKDLQSIGADVWIDEELSEMTIQARLATLEQVAQRNGMAIGVTGPYPLSIQQVKRWYETLGERGIVLAPVTFITKLKQK